MKILTSLIAIFLFSIHMIAAPRPGSNKDLNKYCAKMKEGKYTIVHHGKTLTSEAKLDNGTRIRPDGTINYADGSIVMLKEGECMDSYGKIMIEDDKDKKRK